MSASEIHWLKAKVHQTWTKSLIPRNLSIWFTLECIIHMMRLLIMGCIRVQLSTKGSIHFKLGMNIRSQLLMRMYIYLGVTYSWCLVLLTLRLLIGIKISLLMITFNLLKILPRCHGLSLTSVHQKFTLWSHLLFIVMTTSSVSNKISSTNCFQQSFQRSPRSSAFQTTK